MHWPTTIEVLVSILSVIPHTITGFSIADRPGDADTHNFRGKISHDIHAQPSLRTVWPGQDRRLDLFLESGIDSENPLPPLPSPGDGDAVDGHSDSLGDEEIRLIAAALQGPAEDRPDLHLPSVRNAPPPVTPPLAKRQQGWHVQYGKRAGQGNAEFFQRPFLNPEAEGKGLLWVVDPENRQRKWQLEKDVDVLYDLAGFDRRAQISPMPFWHSPSESSREESLGPQRRVLWKRQQGWYTSYGKRRAP